MNLLLVLFCLILVAACILYTRYRVKTKITQTLEKEIHQRKLTEEQLRISEEKFRFLAEKSMAGICKIRENIIKYVNPMLAKIFEYTPEELIGSSFLDLVYPQDQPAVNEILSQREASPDNPISYEFRGVTKNNRLLHLAAFGCLTSYQNQPAVLETIIDITHRKKAESELLKTMKMESVGILAGGIAHDFNNLLTIIIGNTSMLKLKLGKKDPEIYSFLENIEHASAQAADVAHKFVTFSEGGWPLRKKISLTNILDHSAQLFPDNKIIPYHVTLEPDLKTVYGDERQLRQVFSGILANAYEATSDIDRQINVKAENISLSHGNPYALKKGKYVKISVSDNGHGIPPEIQDKIFDPYFSTKDNVTQKGLGMGLAICYSIIKKHDGHIAISSEPGKGSEVQLYLPIYE